MFALNSWFSDKWRASHPRVQKLSTLDFQVQLLKCHHHLHIMTFYVIFILTLFLPSFHLYRTESYSIKSELQRKIKGTVFENHPKCRIWIFEFWHFPPISVLLKLTCLVTLFDRKLQVFKNSPKWTIFGIFN